MHAHAPRDELSRIEWLCFHAHRDATRAVAGKLALVRNVRDIVWGCRGATRRASQGAIVQGSGVGSEEERPEVVLRCKGLPNREVHDGL